MSEHKPYRRSGRRGHNEHLLLALRLTPKAARDAIDGIEISDAGAGGVGGSDPGAGGRRAVLKARVRAVPEKGKANAAAEKLIAKWLGLAKSSVSVTAGGKSRIKTLQLDGDPDDLAAKLDKAIAKLD